MNDCADVIDEGTDVTTTVSLVSEQSPLNVPFSSAPPSDVTVPVSLGNQVLRRRGSPSYR